MIMLCKMVLGPARGGGGGGARRRPEWNNDFTGDGDYSDEYEFTGGSGQGFQFHDPHEIFRAFFGGRVSFQSLPPLAPSLGLLS